MSNSKHGGGWLGLSIGVGIPATIVAFAANPILGVAALGATVAAFKRGKDMDDACLLDMQDERDEQLRLSREKELQTLRQVWSEEYDDLYDRFEAGDMSEDEFERQADVMMDRYPS